MPTRPFDPNSAAFLADPYRAYAELRRAPRERGSADRAPGLVRVGPPYDAWWVTSHALVTEVCGQRQDVFVKPGGRRGAPPRPFGITAALDDGLFFLHGPRHAEVRALIEPVFRAAIANAEPHAEAVAAELLASALARGRFDLIADYAAPLAMIVFMALLGVPAPDLAKAAKDDPHRAERAVVDRWLRGMLDTHDKTLPDEVRAIGGTTGLALRTYLGLRAGELRASYDPAQRPTVLAGIEALTGAPPGDKALSADEAVNTMAHFALGGYLSTEFLIGTGVTNLLLHPLQWERLQGDGSLLDAAIDEMLRYDAPFQMADRWVDAEAELGGLKIPANSLVTVVYGAANRDPDLFEDPDRFDIGRPDANRHHGFGHGAHRCIGEPLARIVTRVALRKLLATCPWVRLGDIGPFRSDPYFRALTRVELLLR
jgi:hypothetical protein